MNESLEGRRALVTGGGRGTRAAVVARLRAAGADVLATARTRPEHADGPFVTADVTAPGGVDTVVREVRDRFGALDILVHTVGGSSAPGGGFAALTDRHWQDELDLNLLAAVRLDRALLPDVAAGGGGRARVVHPAAAAAVRGDARIRGREGRAHHVQQGAGDGAGAARGAGERGLPRARSAPPRRMPWSRAWPRRTASTSGPRGTG